MKFSLKCYLILFLIHFEALAGPQSINNPKSKEHAEGLPVAELMNSQYFRLSPTKQMEVKDLRGFVEFFNDSKTIKCSFFKKRIPANVKVELASGSIWENITGIPIAKENEFEAKSPNAPLQMKIKLNKGNDSIDFNCEFVSKITGQFESKSDEDQQRASCESRGGIFTHYSRREFDYACDYKLSYQDLKNSFFLTDSSLKPAKSPPLFLWLSLDKILSHRKQRKRA